ncbi:MAG: hypothetical protein IPK16_33470 [Anaerolineales bacterium]|nr:hypothetical protein [Anaerolineales bacterium]
MLRTQTAFVPFSEDRNFPYDGVPYELRRESVLLDSSKVRFFTYPTCLNLPAEDNYSLTFTYPRAYTVAGVSANVTAQLEFDTRRLHNACPDAVPPQLTAFEIYASGSLQRHAPPGQPFELRFDASDPGGACSRVASIALEQKTTGAWNAIPLQQQDGHYVADMPAMPAGTGVSLRVTATDDAGNRLVYTADPAFAVAPSLTLPDVTPIQFLPYIGSRQR